MAVFSRFPQLGQGVNSEFCGNARKLLMAKYLRSLFAGFRKLTGSQPREWQGVAQGMLRLARFFQRGTFENDCEQIGYATSPAAITIRPIVQTLIPAIFS